VRRRRKISSRISSPKCGAGGDMARGRRQGRGSVGEGQPGDLSGSVLRSDDWRAAMSA
jgi:hypothetical protein